MQTAPSTTQESTPAQNPGSTQCGSMCEGRVTIHMLDKMPPTKKTIGFGKAQYDVSAGVLAIIGKAGGRWVYMNGKYFSSKGRSYQNEKELLDAGMVAVTTLKAKRVVFMLKREIGRDYN